MHQLLALAMFWPLSLLLSLVTGSCCSFGQSAATFSLPSLLLLLQLVLVRLALGAPAATGKLLSLLVTPLPPHLHHSPQHHPAAA